MQFAQALNESLSEVGWTDERLCVELGEIVAATQVKRWRKGRAEPALKQFLVLRRVLPGFSERIDRA